MKKFNKFILENLRQIDDGQTATSYVFTGSKYDILKKSKNDVYHDLEFEVHEMMKKRPDLFCKIIKNSKEQLLVEKLDTKQFQKYYDIGLKSLNKNLKSFYISNFNYESAIIKNIKDITKTKEFKNIEQFSKDFLNLKLEIYEYFEDFWNKNIDDIRIFDIRVDLHEENFGFIKGTKQIRCFDPIYINIKK